GSGPARSPTRWSASFEVPFGSLPYSSFEGARMKVTVVGSGFVGQTTAIRILEKGLAEVCLIDIVEGLPQGLALDMKEAAPVERYEPDIVGTNDYLDTQ